MSTEKTVPVTVRLPLSMFEDIQRIASGIPGHPGKGYVYRLLLAEALEARSPRPRLDLVPVLPGPKDEWP